jgi:hypothetical protein
MYASMVKNKQHKWSGTKNTAGPYFMTHNTRNVGRTKSNYSGLSRSNSRNNYSEMGDPNVFYRHDSKVDFGWMPNHAPHM